MELHFIRKLEDHFSENLADQQHEGMQIQL